MAVKTITSCNRCGYATFIPENLGENDYLICPECDNKQLASHSDACKVAVPGSKPFDVKAIGVNADFRNRITSLNSSFSLLRKKYEQVQLAIAATDDILSLLAGDIYRKCSVDIAGSVLTLLTIDIDKVTKFVAKPFTKVASLDSKTTDWLDSPIIVSSPTFVNMIAGIPLGSASNGSVFYLVSMFTLGQYEITGEAIASLDMEMPLDIVVNSLHISGADMDELEDRLIGLETARGKAIPTSGTIGAASSGISPLSACATSGGSSRGSNFRTAEITNPTIAIPALGSFGISINNRIKATGKLMSLKDSGADEPQATWMNDIAENSNCHLVGETAGDLWLLVKFIGIWVVRSTGIHAVKRKESKVLYIGTQYTGIDEAKESEEYKANAAEDNGIVIASSVSLLDQDDYDDAEIVIVNGEDWMNNPEITDMLVHHLASTRTPVCIWTKHPEADLWKLTDTIGELSSGTILRYISSLCPHVSGDLVSAAKRPLTFSVSGPILASQ